MSEPAGPAEGIDSGAASPTAEFVQSIVVRRGGTHEDTVHAAAQASVLAYLLSPDDPRWARWMAGPWVKSVRRARPGEFNRLQSSATATVERGMSLALAWVPTPNHALPDGVHKLQVSGTDFERVGWEPDRAAEPGLRPESESRMPEGQVRLVVDESLGMTTGKTAAQAAHALFGFYLGLNPAAQLAWGDAGLAFTVTGVEHSRFVDLSRHAVVRIHDAGRTEVEPGSATVIALAASLG